MLLSLSTCVLSDALHWSCLYLPYSFRPSSWYECEVLLKAFLFRLELGADSLQHAAMQIRLWPIDQWATSRSSQSQMPSRGMNALSHDSRSTLLKRRAGL